METILQKKRPSVRSIMLRPFTAAMCALLLLAGAGLYGQYVRYYERQLNANNASAVQLYKRAIRDHQTTLETILTLIESDSRVIPLFLTGDGEELDAVFTQAFDSLVQTQGLDYLLFADAKRRVIARLHPPEDTGDIITRPTFAEAEEARVRVTALDAGINGMLTLRRVAPVYHEGELVGFIEAAMDIDAIIRSVSQSQRMDLAFVLNMDRVVDKKMERGMLHANPTGFWVHVDERKIVFTTLKAVDRDFALDLVRNSEKADPGKEENFRIFHDGSYYVADSIGLKDSLGVPLGDLFIIENATNLWQEYAVTALFLLGAGLLILLISRRVIAARLDKADASIQGMLDRIHKGEILLENIFEESETGFILLNRRSREILKINEAALAVFGADTPDAVSLEMLVPLPPDDPIQKQWHAAGSDLNLIALSNGQQTVYCEMNIFYMGSDDEIQCLAIHDVTRIVQLQGESNRHITYLQAVIDQLPGMVCIKDRDLRLTLYNQAFAEFFGNGESLLGKVRHSEWISREAMDKLLKADAEALLSSKPVMAEIEFNLANGQTCTHVVAKHAVTGPDGEISILCIGTDITERSRMEKQLIVLRKKAEEASTAKSQFLARMSHEIRTPMNAILGMAHLALQMEQPPKARGYLDKIQSAATGLLGIINDILDFSKIETGELSLTLSSFSLERLLHGLADSAHVLIGKAPIAFSLRAPRFTEEFTGDPVRLRQVLMSLIDNAAKFTDKGFINLICDVLEEDKGSARLRFTVEDSGIGIAPEHIGKLFDSFMQLDGGHNRKYSGTGLGLTIAQQLVSLMGGVIDVQSVPGSGSAFSFTLTLRKSACVLGEPAPGEAGNEASSGPPAQIAAPAPGSAPARVLVVEDNLINQEIIVELLNNYGLETQAVDNGEKAVEAVAKERFDLVLMDLQMPVMDGLTATRAIRDAGRGEDRLPIIALTANAMPQDKEQCLAAGMNDFLSKPIAVEQLRAALERWLPGAA